MHKYGATFGPLPNPEEAPHEGMVKALVPFCGLDDESIFHDSLASESRTFKKAIVMNMKDAIQTWIDCLVEGIERFTGIKVELHFAEIVNGEEHGFQEGLYCWVSMRDIERLMEFINNNKKLKDFLARAIKFETDPSTGIYYPHYNEGDFRPLSYDCPSVLYEVVFEAVLEHDVIYKLEERWDEKFKYRD